jgi:hypothetical protein
MPDSPVTVVDMRAGVFSSILKELDDAKLLADVRAGALDLILIHVIGPTVNSVGEIEATAKRIGGGAKHLIVKNHINDAAFLLLKEADLSIPQLAEIATETVQKSGQSFRDFSKDPNQSRMLRGKVVAWLQQVWAEFEKINVKRLVGQP